MTPAGDAADTAARTRAETDIAADIRALTAVSEQLAHLFSAAHSVRSNDFRALMHIATAESEGHPLTAGGLRELMGVSPAAITYLVDRLIDSGHIRRETDPGDRRRVLLRYSEHGMAVAGEFFGPLGQRTRSALRSLPTGELAAAHRVLHTVIAALREHHADLTRQADTGGDRPRPGSPGP